MKRIVLNIICNNDAHTIGKMLESVRSLVDAVVAIEVGSTDETIATIKKFGFLSGIPTFVYKRPFDNFSNSRNYALEKLEAVVRDLSWQPTQVWVLAIDCNEILKVPDKFQKDDLKDDFYLVSCRQNRKQFMKRVLFRFITPANQTAKPSVLASWQLTSLNRDLPMQNTAKDYAELLLEYSDNTTHVESIAPIIRNHMMQKQWHLAHLFSSFAYKTFHNKMPELDENSSPIEVSLYEWELMYYHYLCCVFTKRSREAKALSRKLKKYAFTHPANIRFIQLISLFVPAIYRSGHLIAANR